MKPKYMHESVDKADRCGLPFRALDVVVAFGDGRAVANANDVRRNPPACYRNYEKDKPVSAVLWGEEQPLGSLSMTYRQLWRMMIEFGTS